MRRTLLLTALMTVLMAAPALAQTLPQAPASDLFARAKFFARIGQPGGEESLNVAAAAAICLHASSL